MYRPKFFPLSPPPKCGRHLWTIPKAPSYNIRIPSIHNYHNADTQVFTTVFAKTLYAQLSRSIRISELQKVHYRQHK